MKQTIYIRKENEDWWREHGSSAWVNEQIKDCSERVGVVRVHPSNPKGGFELAAAKLCEHVRAKGFCRYPGCRNN